MNAPYSAIFVGAKEAPFVTEMSTTPVVNTAIAIVEATELLAPGTDMKVLVVGLYSVGIKAVVTALFAAFAVALTPESRKNNRSKFNYGIIGGWVCKPWTSSPGN